MAKARRSRRFRSAEEIEEIVGSYNASGLTQMAFARSRGLSPSSLSYWLCRARRGRRPSPKRAALVPVRVVAASVSASPYEVQLANDRLVRVPVGFDVDELRRLLAAVEAAC